MKNLIQFNANLAQRWSWHFHQILDLGFSEISQNFSSFRQLHSFQCWKIAKTNWFLSFFSFGTLLETKGAKLNKPFYLGGLTKIMKYQCQLSVGILIRWEGMAFWFLQDTVKLDKERFDKERLFVSRVSLRYCLTNVSVFAVFPKAMNSSAESLTRRVVQRPGLWSILQDHWNRIDWSGFP